MATGVVMNSSPGPSASGVQPHNSFRPRMTPEEAMERLMERARSPLGEAEVRRVVETLQRLSHPRIQMTLRARRRCFRGLVKICGEHGILPSSYIIPESKIKPGDSLASGGFSEVLRGTYEGNKSVAIKVIRLYDVYSLNVQGTKGIKEVKKNFCREVITWKRLSHPNVLELIGVMMDDKEYTMVMPLMKNGTIVDFLRVNAQANPLKLLEDAVRGLQYLHSIELAHGDLKGANILVSDDLCACLADVGLTRVAGDMVSAATSHTSTSSGANTRRWCPPELLNPERFKSKRGGPTKKADMYSMGMTIYEVLTDNIPFSAWNDNVAILCILEGVRPKTPIFAATRGYTDKLWEMTTSCWKEDPSDRPTVDHVLALLENAAEESRSYAQLTLEWMVNQILDRARLPMGEDEAWDVVETLEETMLETHDQMNLRTKSRCFQVLVKICGEHGILHDSYIIPESKFRKLGDNPVSSDGFSEVWPGVYEEDKYIAIRVIRCRGAEGARTIKKNFCREVVTWKSLSHPNISELIGVTMGDEQYTMVSPWMENIVEFLREEDTEANPLKLLEDATRGLQHLHNMDLIHGDLRGANILIGDGRACLADAAGGSRRAMSSGCNIMRWSPPELLDTERSKSQRGGPTKESDIYSMSMTIYEVLTDRLPFHEHSDTVAMVYILKGDRPEKPIFSTTRGYTEGLWEMTTSCWKRNPSDRPTVDDVLSVLKKGSYELTIKRMVDRILDGTMLPMGEDEAWDVVERLETMLEPHDQVNPRTKTRYFQVLVKICGEYNVLPNSYIIPEPKFQKLGGKPISSDGFSEVWPGVYEEEKSIAIRVIRYRDAEGAQEIKKNFFREVVTWKSLSHPNISELIGVTMGDEQYTMVSPWMEKNIVEFLKEDTKANPLKLLEDATRGLQYLHNMDLVHGDLRGANILIDDDDCACLADAAAGSRRATSSGCNITRWSPPELLDTERSKSQRGGLTKESDIYSMSMTIYEVLTDRHPFHEHSDTVTKVYILKGERPEEPIFSTTRGYTEKLWEMTTSCWKEDPSDRPTVDYVLALLKDAAEQWEPKHEAFPPFSPQDDRNTAFAEESDSDTQLTLEEMVDRILDGTMLPMEEDEAWDVVDILETMLEPHDQVNPRTKTRCFQALVKICGEYNVLPDSYIIPEPNFRKLGDSPISSDGFSEVWPGVYEEEKSIAIRVIRYRDAEGAQEIKKNFFREVVTWKSLSHPNISELIGVTMGDEQYTMVSPWMENIVEFFREEDTEANPLKLLEDAARGLQHLHNMDLVHGDLRGANILIDGDGRACLADAAAGSQRATSSGCNIMRWCPPELLDPERFQSKRGGPTTKADIYSMGMTIYEVLTDGIPFSACNDNVAILCVLDNLRPTRPIFAATRGYTEELWKMTTTCWKEDPSDRPTVDDVLCVLKNAAEKWTSRLQGTTGVQPLSGRD